MKNGHDLIQSLDRGLFLLDAISESPGDVSLGELKERLGIDKSSVFRLLATLINRGYAEQDRLTKHYRLGYKVITLSGRLSAKLRIAEQARPFLKELALGTKETSHLAIISAHESVLIDQEIGAELVTVNTEIGRHEPLHATALGKVLLSSYSGKELNDFLSGFKLARYTPNTIVDKLALKKEIEKVRKAGFAVDNVEYRASVRCIASPVRDVKGSIIAAIGISGPKERITRDRVPGLAEVVKKTALKVSDRLGFKV